MMRTRKLTIYSIIVLLLLTGAKGLSQNKIDYSELYKIIKEGDQEKSYTLLLDYQKNDPNFANTYFQLGIIAKKWAFDFNPFTDYEYTKLFIYNTKLYFNLAKHKLADEKKKNYDYYLNAITLKEGEKINQELITGYIDKEVGEVTEYEEKIKEIIKYFQKSSDKYNDCVNNFMIINAEYNNIKNLYLSDNEENDERIRRLKIDFDSVLVYFDLYKQALASYPLKGYDQKYRLQHIITFRLDGLTASNFLNNEIILWNYKKWVDDVQQIQGKIISTNKDEISVRNAAILKTIDDLSDAVYSDTVKNFKIEDKFIFKIEKYDVNSFLLELFKLNEGIINYLISYNKQINNPEQARLYSLTEQSAYALNFYEEYKRISKQNASLEKNINADHIKKYKNFYMSAYNGVQGLRDYSFRQKLLLQEKKDKVFEHLKEKLYHTVLSPKIDSLVFKGQKIYLYKGYPSTSNKADGYKLCDFDYDKSGRLLFTGFYVNTKNKFSGFSGYINDAGSTPVIASSLETDTADLFYPLIIPFSDGYFTIQTSVGKSITNTLIKYDLKGKELFKRLLTVNKQPRMMFFDDINNTLTIIFNGSNFNPLEETDDEQIVYIINPDDPLLKYEYRFYARSQVFDALKLNNRYLIFSNCEYYIDSEGKKISSWMNETNASGLLISVLSVQGELEKQVPIQSKLSCIGIKAVKINSNTINVLGYETTKSVKTLSDLNKEVLFWGIIDSNLEPVYIGWHD